MRAVALLTAIALTAGAGLAAAAVATGDKAPDFSLTDTKGKTHKLAELTGKYVVLEWINYDCPFVRKHYESGNMTGLQKEYTAKGVVWFSISSSAPGKSGNYSAEEWNRMSQEKGSAATAVLLDGDGTVGRAYDAKVTPHMFLIGPDGKLLYQGAIDDNPGANKAEIASSKNFVKAALDEAMAGKAVTTGTTKPYGCGIKY
jgi:peroxiredoxin